MSKLDLTQILALANSAPYEPIRSGCGRAYVVITDSKTTVNAVARACKTLGLMFLKKAYGTGNNAIYIGYDNADGRALGKARAFANSLQSSGVSCYDDAVGD